MCHLGAVCANTLFVSDVGLLLGKPRSCDLERRAVELRQHHAGRHGRICNGHHPFAKSLGAAAF